jgi:hypothetical protein
MQSSANECSCSTKSQKALWQRLDDLNKRRQTLEGQILASMKSIEDHTINMTKEMAAVFKGRTEEITGEGSSPDE